MKLLRTVAVLALLGVAGWQGAFWYRRALADSRKPPDVGTTKVTRGDLPITLSGYGTLEAANTFVVRNQQVQSQIVDIAQDGVLVTKGEVVVRLDPTKIEKDLRDRRLAYETATAQVKKVEADELLNVKNASTKMTKAEQEQALLLSSNRADLAQSQAKVRYDQGELTYRQRDLDRTRSLAKDLLVPAALVESADLNVKSKELEVTQGERDVDVKQHEQRSATAQGQLLISDAKYSATAATNRSEEAIANAKFNADAALRMLQLSEMQLKWCEVQAPASGLTVIARDWDPATGAPRTLRPGDPVRPSSRFMEIIDLSRMRVIASMSEMDVSQIQAGQPVRVWPRSAPEKVLRGRVSAISSLARQGDIWRRGSIPGKKTFRVVIDILESRPDLLRPGMTADFEVIQQQVAKVLRVPLQAVFKTSLGTSVFIKKGPRFVARPVKLGQRNANYAAVASGLKGGEVIALQRPPLELLRAPVAKSRKPPTLLQRALGIF